MKKIEHIFFDLDHTLWDFETNSAKTFEHILKNREIAIDLDEFLKVYVPINLKYWRLFRNEEVSKEELRYKRLKEVFDILKYNASDDLINTLAVDYIDNLSSYNHLFEGTIETLTYLKSKYKLHIITNGFEEVQHKKLKNSGLLGFFETITTSECVGVKKPNPLIFEQAFKVSNAKPEVSVMIGDSLEADIEGALNMGMEAILCDFEQKHSNLELKMINELSQLKEYI